MTLRGFVFQTVFVAAAAVFLLATGTRAGIVALLLIVWAAVFLCAWTAAYLRRRSRLRELESIMNGLDKKYLFFECIPPAPDAYERRLLALFRRAGKSMIETVSDAQEAGREYREYVES